MNPIPLPEALLTDLRSIPAFSEEAFLAAHALPPPTSVRLHPVKGGNLFKNAPEVPWCPSGRYLFERPAFTLDPLFHAGAYYVQEASSMLLHHLWQHTLGGQKSLRVLDLCGAPGGKSTLIASLLDEHSLLIANDVIRSRASILDESITRWGYTNTWVTSNDARDFGRLPGFFDALIVDAPCSGSGLFRKDTHALDEWSEDAVALCAARQQRILADAWPCLKSGGILFYATCSYSPVENEGILDWLAGQGESEGIDVPMPDAWDVVKMQSGRGLTSYRCFPDRVAGEGFFIAAVRKTASAKPFYYPRFRTAFLKKAERGAREYLRPGIAYTLLEDERRDVTAIYPWHEPDHHFLSETLYLRRGGVRLGKAAQKDWIPEHDVALSLDAHPAIPRWELTREEALCFLKKEELPPREGVAKGWQMASYSGRGLGWVKVLSNRVNNYLPKSWRIRMELPGEEGLERMDDF